MREQSNIIFSDESVNLTFEDLQPVIEFKDESETLKFDIVNPFSDGIFDKTFDDTFN